MSEKLLTQIILNSEKLETRMALLRNHRLEEYQLERVDNSPKPGSIYLGRIINLEPSLQAAFVDIGAGRNAFLHYHDMLVCDHEIVEVGKIAAAPAAGGDGETAAGNGKRPRRRGRSGSAAAPDEGKQGKALELRKRASNRKKLKMEDIPSIYPPGTEILVQVEKGEIGSKGARVTTNISIAGRYLVLLPYSPHIGLSTKIDNAQERERLRKILAALEVPDGMGLICRTVGEGRKSAFFQNDLELLLDSWRNLEHTVNTRKAPVQAYSEPNLIERTVRDFLTDDIDQIVIDGNDGYERISSLLDRFGGRKLSGKVEHYRQAQPIFERYKVTSQLNDVMRREVKLPSGGWICVDETEALIAIDVNTGHGKRQITDQPELILKTNLEAADEIARQLKLRDVGGQVVIDFIDMRSAHDRDEVFRSMKKLMKQDRAKTKILPLSRLGLMEMTRQREQESVLDRVFDPCPCCRGSGLIKSALTMSVEIQRELHRVLLCREWRGRALRVVMHPVVLERLKNEDAALLDELEKSTGNDLSFRADPSLHYEEFHFVDPVSGNRIEVRS
ncbi:MAG: Rne/Rng family ribonuclease [Victivallaceae bacterium]|nr:Rne/Rng family ribonuclease [Victivallaceae bacterium]